MKVIEKSNKFLSELQRIVSILSYSVDVEDDYETVLAHSQNPEEDKKIVDFLVKSNEKLDKEAESFLKHIGTQTKPRKTKKQETSNINIIDEAKALKKSKNDIKSSKKDMEIEH